MKAKYFVAILFSAITQLAGAEPFDLEERGIVQEVDLAKGLVTIAGYRYKVAQGSPINIAGNASSIAAVAVGMKVRYVLRTFEGLDAQIQGKSDRKVVVEIEQLPDSTNILQY